MIGSFVLHGLCFFVPPLMTILLRKDLRARAGYAFILALGLHLGFVGCLAAGLHRLMAFGWPKLFIILLLSTVLTNIVLKVGNSTSGLFKRAIFFPAPVLVILAGAAFLFQSDNFFIFLHQGWPFEQGRVISLEEPYFRPPLNNDIERHLVVVNALVRQAESTPFLPGSRFVYQIFWHHIESLFLALSSGLTFYSHLAGGISALTWIFFLVVLWSVFLLRPSWFLRRYAGWLIVAMLFLHSDIYYFIYSFIAQGRPGIEADWSISPVFFRNFSIKLIGLTAPQHALFFIFFLIYLFRDRWGRILTPNSFRAARYLFFILCLISSPLLSVFCFLPMLGWEVFKRVWGGKPFLGYVGEIVFLTLVSLAGHEFLLGFPVFDLFSRPGLGGLEYFPARLRDWLLLPLLWVAMTGVVGLLVTGVLFHKVLLRRWVCVLSSPSVLIFGGALFFFYGLGGVEIRRHFALVSSVIGLLFLARNLPSLKALSRSLLWRTALVVTFCFGVFLHGYYLFCYMGKPSRLEAGLAWKDYFEINQVIQGKFKDLPTIAAVDPRNIGLEKPPVMEVTTSFSLAHHTFAHIKASSEQTGLLNLIGLRGEVAPIAGLLGYRAVLWGPVEQRVWGERIKERFIDETKLIARSEKVGLYWLEDKLRKDFPASRWGRDSRLRFAERCLDGGWLTEAIAAYLEILHEEPLNASAHLGLGLALFYFSRFEEALNEFDSTIKLAPSLSRAHFYRAAIKSREGNLEDAIRGYEEAIRWNARYGQAYNNLGVCLIQMKKYEEAEWILRKALFVGREDSPRWISQAELNLGRSLFNQKKYRESIRMIEKSLEGLMDAEERKRALWELASAYLALGAEDKAAILYQQAVQKE